MQNSVRFVPSIHGQLPKVYTLNKKSLNGQLDNANPWSWFCKRKSLSNVKESS